MASAVAPRRPRIFAHRGASRKAPENTLAAFRLAADLGADGVELDVHLAADGIPVVIHDATLERTTSGRGRVGEHPSSALRRLDAGGWFAPAFAGEGVPLLTEVLALAAQRGLWLNVELKVAAPEGPDRQVEAERLAERVVAALHQAGLVERTVISSFAEGALRAVKARAPELECALLLAGPRLRQQPPAWELAQALGVEGIHPAHGAIDAAWVKRCRSLGLAVRPWTVNDVVRCRELAVWGVDGLITDVPDQVLALWADGGR